MQISPKLSNTKMQNQTCCIPFAFPSAAHTDGHAALRQYGGPHKFFVSHLHHCIHLICATLPLHIKWFSMTTQTKFRWSIKILWLSTTDYSWIKFICGTKCISQKGVSGPFYADSLLRPTNCGVIINGNSHSNVFSCRWKTTQADIHLNNPFWWITEKAPIYNTSCQLVSFLADICPRTLGRFIHFSSTVTNRDHR